MIIRQGNSDRDHRASYTLRRYLTLDADYVAKLKLSVISEKNQSMAMALSIIPVMAIARPFILYFGPVSLRPMILSSNPTKGRGNTDNGEKDIIPKMNPNSAGILSDFRNGCGVDELSIVTSNRLLI